ncbi:hypothetical protein AN958_06208 [Leucoagaricus sp. SymC.cos]|nr:hypothetical protein AN958_06208 [Leucoagaricus sp. SymC.cos]
MDYDRNDALLHWLFRQTQGDAWFRPSEESISSGVALRVSDAEFRVFPYENETLEPFETAVCALNPLVAVKVRSAAVHAALAEVEPDAKSIYVDANTRIQILDTMLHLPQADREQCAAFIRDERVMVIWSESLDRIVPACHDFDERLIKLLWRSRPQAHAGTASPAPSSLSPSVDGHTPSFSIEGKPPSRAGATVEGATIVGAHEKGTRVKRNWFGKKNDDVDLESQWRKRPTKLYAPFYNGLAAALSFVFIGNGIRILLREFSLDASPIRFALLLVAPLLICISLFFSMQLIQNIVMAVGPIAHYHSNSTYYSAVKPKPNREIDNNLPHITIQMPVYKESLEKVLSSSIMSLKKAMQTYARQGGSSCIFVCDDGLRLLSPAERDERILYYANHNIGWVARPRHDPRPGGFKRAGRFKKASNMNYGLALSLKAEKHLERLLAESSVGHQGHQGQMLHASASNSRMKMMNQHGLQYQNRDGTDSVVWGVNGQSSSSHQVRISTLFYGGGLWRCERTEDTKTVGSERSSVTNCFKEERALALAIEETYLESQHSSTESGSGDANGPRTPRPWAANGRALRIGEFLLVVDADTVVPEDCLRDAVREFYESDCDVDVRIIQHESEVMQVVGHWFENGMAYFTRRINRCISMSCANGEVAPFVGHNAFLRWKAMQDAAFIDPVDGKEKIWSESNVSEDFDMALRLLQKGYIIRFLRWKAMQDAAFIDPVDGKEKIWSESNVSEDFDMALRLLQKGYIIRWATYSKGGFKEGVSLSVDDELNRWQKYAYGCNELLFNPLVQWWRRGPIAPQIHKFIWSKAPLHYKISMLSYMFSYYGIAASFTISLINYVLLGFQFPVDGWFMHSFEIWLATCVVFWGTGTVGYTLLEYRLGLKKLLPALLENLLWIPFFFFFFGGLAIPLTQAILAHLFSYNIQWTATIKEVQRSNFFKEIPKIWKRFWFSILMSWVVVGGVVVCATRLVPYEWRVGSEGWAVVLPLAMSVGCHILFPIVLNPWLMVFSY